MTNKAIAKPTEIEAIAYREATFAVRGLEMDFVMGRWFDQVSIAPGASSLGSIYRDWRTVLDNHDDCDWERAQEMLDNEMAFFNESSEPFIKRPDDQIERAGFPLCPDEVRALATALLERQSLTWEEAREIVHEVRLRRRDELDIQA